MFGYYIRLAAISIRKNPAMSLLMVIAIALGIGTCMTIITVNYVMAKDPIPAKSAALFAVQLDTWDPNQPARDDGSPPNQVTYLDALALMEKAPALRQAASTAVSIVIEPANVESRPFEAQGRVTYKDFFAMFDIPFLYGAPWDAEADRDGEHVIVLSRETNERLFGGADSVGKHVRINGNPLTVIGVLDTWNPTPKFFDPISGPFNRAEEVYMPFPLFRDLSLNNSGSTNCWKPVESGGPDAFFNSECVWIQFWAELPDATAQSAYLDFLDAYAMEQKALGRFQRPLNNRLSDVNQWMDDQRVVQDEALMLVPVALMFLAVCLLNTIGLLLAKFLNKTPEIGLRRALGASRRTLFMQYLMESGCIGVAGGIVGIALTWLGLLGIKALFSGVLDDLIRLDWQMVGTAIVLAVFSSMAAGLYPTWRACSVEPASQLKLQ